MRRPKTFFEGLTLGFAVGLPFAFLIYGSFDYWEKTLVQSFSFWPIIGLFTMSLIMTIISGASGKPIFKKDWIDASVYGFVLMFDLLSIFFSVQAGHL